MEKPIVFFSHSTNDKDFVLKIKDKIDGITGGALNVFMSSDGQSIPLGRNWVHKIEEGLNAAQIMFVFVTPNSILSNWIYFEAGFAYSKEIEVIPVGVGIDISLLKAPLNILQGFNITSNESLNNFLSVINKKFDYHYKDSFTETDYRDIVSAINDVSTPEISSVFSHAECVLRAENKDGNGGKISFDIKEYWKRIKDFLTTSNFDFSCDEQGHSVLLAGIKVVGHIEQNPKSSDYILITISPYNIPSTFPVLAQILTLLPEKEWFDLCFHLNANYAYVTSQEKMSAMMSTMSTDFSFQKSQIGGYQYLKADLTLIVSKIVRYRSTPEYVLKLSFRPNITTAKDIIDCICLLLNKGIIYPQEGQDGK